MSSEKPRLKYAEFAAKNQRGTVAWLIERYIVEMNGLNGHPPIKILGISHVYNLRLSQRMPIGAKMAATLTKHDVIDHCKERFKKVIGATINQDFCYLSGVMKYAPSAWDDCEGVSDAAFAAARPFLTKHGYISKSTPRKRIPTDEEIGRLLDHFEKRDRQKGVTVKMVPLILFALASTRRISEICRLAYGDIAWDHVDNAGRSTPMYMIRDLKHPTKKKGNDKRFPLFADLAEIINRQPRLRPDDPAELVFPYRSQSASATYTLGKKALGIVDLRFHDNRRHAITRYLKKLPPHKVKLISGHETTQILERVYDAQKPEELHQELESMLKSVDGQPYNHTPTWRS